VETTCHSHNSRKIRPDYHQNTNFPYIADILAWWSQTKQYNFVTQFWQYTHVGPWQKHALVLNGSQVHDTTRKKVYITPTTIKGGLLHSQTIKLNFLPLELFKTGQITPKRFWTVVLLQWQWFCLFPFYLFPLNLWKIILNHRKIIK
jgi:hypothetical protein